MKVIFKTYEDILEKIDILQAEIEALQTDLDYWIGKKCSHPLFSQEAEKYDLDFATHRVNFLYKRIRKLEKRSKAYIEIEKEIRENVEKLPGLEYKIAKLRYFERLTYKEIAENLGYSYSYIRKIVAKAKNEVTKKFAQ